MRKVAQLGYTQDSDIDSDHTGFNLDGFPLTELKNSSDSSDDDDD